jgi:rhodanese-related sulfurtransferase
MRFKPSEYTVREVADLLKSPRPPKLLDTREAPEWEQAHLNGSQPLTEALIDEVLKTWDRSTPIVTVCHHGVRSMNLARFLQQQGFTDVRSMKGGVEAWALEIDPTLPRY